MKRRVKKPADAAPPDLPPAGRGGVGPDAGKRKSGAQPGNRSAVSHGAYLNTLKRGVRATRDKHRRKAEAEALAILAGCGLTDDPLAGLVARQVRRLETMAGRLEAHLDSRGVFLRDGSVKPAVKSFVEVVERLLGEARRLLEQLASLAPKSVGDVVFRAYVDDDSPLHPDATPGPAAAPPERPDADPAPMLPPRESEAQRRLDAIMERHEQRTGELPAPPPAPMTDAQREWERMDDGLDD